MTDSGRLFALGANNLNLGCINCAFGFNDSGRISCLAGLNVLLNNVDTLNNNLAFLGAYGKNLALFSAVLIVSGKKNDGIAGFNE